MRSRGYRMRDIAVLVRAHSERRGGYFGALWHTNDRATMKIAFVSEDSLRLVSSEGVRILEAALRSVASGARPDIDTAETEGVRKKSGELVRHGMRLPGFSLSVTLICPWRSRCVCSCGRVRDFDALGSVLGDMQTLALPALVEGSGRQSSDASVRPAPRCGVYLCFPGYRA